MNKTQCEHKENCYRMNPLHFEQFSHEHLDGILKTQDSEGNYQIPDTLKANTEKIMQQLAIIKDNQKKNKRTAKTEDEGPATKLMKVQDPEESSSSQGTMSSTSNSQETDKMKNNMTVFFKERAARFKAQDPEQMKAPPSPAPIQRQATQNTSRVGIAEKMRNASPYNFFLSTIAASPQTHSDPLSITFQELLDSSLGDLESSVQFCCMSDPDWLVSQYTSAALQHIPLLVIYGEERAEASFKDITQKHPNIVFKRAAVPGVSGVHHSKMMFFFYKDKSMRVVVSTANLTAFDWNNLAQGLWISEKLPPIPDGPSDFGDSETGFRRDLIKYLLTYQIPRLQQVIAKVMKADFRSVKVFFVSSSPGEHRYQEASANNGTRGFAYGHPRIGEILNQHSAQIADSSPIIAQSSTLGMYGPYPNMYLLGQFAQSFRRDSGTGTRKPDVQVIYPSVNNVTNSHDRMAGGGCLVYSNKVHASQLWLKDHLFQWRSQNRNQAMPHIKSYCRYSDQGLYWFVLTSANLTRNALGTVNWKTKTIKINNYEAGVLFLPRVMIGKDYFPMNERQKQGEKIFKLPFDVPLVPYARDDSPYTTDGSLCAPS